MPIKVVRRVTDQGLVLTSYEWTIADHKAKQRLQANSKVPLEDWRVLLCRDRIERPKQDK